MGTSAAVRLTGNVSRGCFSDISPEFVLGVSVRMSFDAFVAPLISMSPEPTGKGLRIAGVMLVGTKLVATAGEGDRFGVVVPAVAIRGEGQRFGVVVPVGAKAVAIRGEGERFGVVTPLVSTLVATAGEALRFGVPPRLVRGGVGGASLVEGALDGRSGDFEASCALGGSSGGLVWWSWRGDGSRRGLVTDLGEMGGFLGAVADVLGDDEELSVESMESIDTSNS